MFRVGLTGGIGSGKSTVAQMLCNAGAVLVDADSISRACTQDNGAAISLIQAEFGSNFITVQGALNRDKMRELVFSDPGARLRLEAIIHPLVAQEIERLTQEAQRSGTKCVVFDVPLLAESNRWRQKVDLVLVVDCSSQTQVERTTLRSGLTAESVEKIIASQASRSRRLLTADLVIFNDQLLLTELETLVQEIRPRFGL